MGTGEADDVVSGRSHDRQRAVLMSATGQLRGRLRAVSRGRRHAASVLAAAPAANAQTEDFFVLDTQFVPGPTTVVDAGGAFEGCWKSSDLWGNGIQLPDGTVWFEGEKRLQCASGAKVTVYYIVQQVPHGTAGTWEVTASSLAGATSGGGTLVGDSTACTPAKKADGCILDTFSGTVS